MTAGDRWDAVVVGGGTAGCAVAAGLAGSGRRVLLVEAGPGEPRPASVAGIDVIAAAGEQTRLWPGSVVMAEPGSAPYPYRQGRGLGGGSMVNSLLLSPGDRADYRRWAEEHRCGGWGPEDMDPWLSRATARFPGRSLPPGAVSLAFESAAGQGGHPIGGSSMDQDRLGVLEARLAIDGDRRRSVVEAYLGGATGGHGPDANPQIRTRDTVQRILMDGGRASGVQLSAGGRVLAPLVVVCCGAIGTPVLLHRSGLLPEPFSRTLKDHPSFAFTLTLRREAATIEEEPAGQAPTGDDRPVSPRRISRLLRWSSGPGEHGDLQAFVIDRVDDPAARPGHGGLQQRPTAVVVVGLMRVSSSGTITPATPATPATPVRSDGGWPDVVIGGPGAADDRRRLGSGVRFIHELLQSEPLRAMVEEIHLDDIGTPAGLLATMDDDALERWLAAHPGPYAHPAATCPMGPESAARSVVDHRPDRAGRLLGWDGIYLADASIMPDLVQGGLQIPVLALAERVAQGIIAAG